MSRSTYSINNRHFEVWRGWYYHTPKPQPEIPYDVQLVTLRLVDALPASELQQMELDARMVQPAKHVHFKRQRTQDILNAGHGSCALQHAEVARAVLDVLEDQHAKRYKLIAWCIMPNQLHVLIEPCFPLARIVQDWKAITTRWALQHNTRLGLTLKNKGLWMKRYQDRFIRDKKHLTEVIHDLHESPVVAGLCETPEEWHWSSAHNKRH